MTGPRFLAAVAALLACAATAARAGALSTRFSTVLCEDVPYGATVAPRLPDGTGYSLSNGSDAPVRVLVRPQRPTFCEPVPGQKPFRPLPTNCVVRVEPAVLDIAPHATAEAMVTIELPDDPALEGGRFETWLHAGTARGAMGVALVSRIRIVVGGHAETESHAESAETESHAESAETESHAESAERAETESHAESAESAETESHAENAESAETESHAKSAESAENDS